MKSRFGDDRNSNEELQDVIDFLIINEQEGRCVQQALVCHNLCLHGCEAHPDQHIAQNWIHLSDLLLVWLLAVLVLEPVISWQQISSLSGFPVQMRLDCVGWVSCLNVGYLLLCAFIVGLFVRVFLDPSFCRDSSCRCYPPLFARSLVLSFLVSYLGITCLAYLNLVYRIVGSDELIRYRREALRGEGELGGSSSDRS